MMDNRRQIKQAVEISKLYYLDGATQAEIAKKLHLSRPTISRALQFARDNQIVKIQVSDPLSDLSDLREQVKERYHLDEVVIATPDGDGTAATLDALGAAAAKYLEEVVVDNDTLGISWGQTLAAVARHLQPSARKNIRAVYLKGTVANSTHNNYVVEVTKAFNRCFHTQAQILPLPVIFENKDVKEMVVKDRFINEILMTGRQATVDLFTVGTTEPDATLFELGYLSDQQIAQLQKESVGDIISQFVDEKGKIVDEDLTARTVALPLNELKNTRQSILIAGGMNKLKPIKAALAGRYANVLVTDVAVAQHLIGE
ncbi:sugar-binding transcriptional regulator [Limosilactobacillus viscerum]|uniref:sugar-binding transcriptional regulator n=1 Tax=Limosilactobacillus viscerum TaxID=2993450 RepID=UPI002DD6625E|nr:sugar-binding transcriptional regulator [Limosilactobacillus viscerum]